MVYIYRNPKDALVSYFHFYNTRSFAPKVPKFEDFFQIFKDDKLPFGNYFDHINGRKIIPSLKSLHYLPHSCGPVNSLCRILQAA